MMRRAAYFSVWTRDESKGKMARGILQKVEKRIEEERRKKNLFKVQGANLYVKNLDRNIVSEQLRMMFRKYGFIQSARVMTDVSGRSRGFGFVCFSTEEEAAFAMAEIHGREIY